MTMHCQMILYDQRSPKALAFAINSASRLAFVIGLSSEPKCSLNRPVVRTNVRKCSMTVGSFSRKGIDVALRLSFVWSICLSRL